MIVFYLFKLNFSFCFDTVPNRFPQPAATAAHGHKVNHPSNDFRLMKHQAKLIRVARSQLSAHERMAKRQRRCNLFIEHVQTCHLSFRRERIGKNKNS